MTETPNEKKREVVSTPLATKKGKKQNWLWEGFIPLGTATLMSGPGGVGKSSLVAWIVAQATNGELRGDLYGKPQHVSIIAEEDDTEAVLVPRLLAAGADMNLIDQISVQTFSSGYLEEGLSSPPQIKRDLDEIRNLLHENGTGLLVIDPVTAMQRDDNRRSEEVRESLEMLLSLAQKEQIGLLLISHFTKGTGPGTTIRSATAGSHEYWNLARSVIGVAKDPDTDYRVLTQAKSNYGKPQESLSFSITDGVWHTEEGDAIDVGLVTLLGVSEVTVDDILGRVPTSTDPTLADDILDIMRNGLPMKAQDILSHFEASEESAVRKQLERLVKKDKLTKPQRGYFQLDINPTVSNVQLSKTENLTQQDTTRPVPVKRIGHLDNSTNGELSKTCPRHDWPLTPSGCPDCVAESQGIAHAS